MGNTLSDKAKPKKTDPLAVGVRWEGLEWEGFPEVGVLLDTG